MKRKATSVWNGSGKNGSGHLTTQSTVLNETQYSFSSRFEQGIGTNPEELVAAAHAGCFNMKLAFVLQGKDITPTSLTTECTITLEEGGITSSHLDLKAVVPGISEDDFAACVKEAEENCPISMLLDTSISVTSELSG